MCKVCEGLTEAKAGDVIKLTSEENRQFTLCHDVRGALSRARARALDVWVVPLGPSKFSVPPRFAAADDVVSRVEIVHGSNPRGWDSFVTADPFGIFGVLSRMEAERRQAEMYIELAEREAELARSRWESHTANDTGRYRGQLREEILELARENPLLHSCLRNLPRTDGLRILPDATAAIWGTTMMEAVIAMTKAYDRAVAQMLRRANVDPMTPVFITVANGVLKEFQPEDLRPGRVELVKVGAACRSCPDREYCGFNEKERAACHGAMAARIEELEAELAGMQQKTRLCADHGGNASDPTPTLCPECARRNKELAELRLGTIKDMSAFLDQVAEALGVEKPGTPAAGVGAYFKVMEEIHRLKGRGDLADTSQALGAMVQEIVVEELGDQPTHLCPGAGCTLCTGETKGRES